MTWRVRRGDQWESNLFATREEAEDIAQFLAWWVHAGAGRVYAVVPDAAGAGAE